MRKQIVLPVCVAALAFATAGIAETWLPFSSHVKLTAYAAQYQRLERDGKVIGKHLVTVYWKHPDFRDGLLGDVAKEIAWSLRDYNRETDVLVTEFVFYGLGQHNWTVSPNNGVILYPGTTAHRAPGEEIACSATQFHELLVEIGSLKRADKDIEGNIELPIFGKKQKTK